MPSLIERFVDAFKRGEQDSVVAIVVIKPVGYDVEEIEKGRRARLKIGWLAFEPLDASKGDDVDAARHMLDRAMARRATPQQRLPLDWGSFNDPDQRAFLLTCLNEWAEETDKVVLEEWWRYFGEGFGVEIPEKASVLQLREFALECGALADELVTAAGEPTEGERAAMAESEDETPPDDETIAPTDPEFAEPTPLAGRKSRA